MGSRRSVAPGFLAGVVLLAGCGGGSDAESASASDSGTPVAALPATPMSAQDAAALDEAIEGIYTPDLAPEYPGLWVGVWDPEHGAYVKSWGNAVVGGAAATVDDSLRIGSVTKTVTATVVLQLVDEGELALDDTVATAAPKVAQAHPETADLSIRQLLSMTSGLADYMNVPDRVVAVTSTDPTTVWSADQLIDAGISAGVKPAGTGGYSTTNYIVLQEVAEEVTGQGLQDLIARRITGPLGMTGSALPLNEDTSLPEPAAHGYLNAGCAEEVAADGGKAEGGQDVTAWNASYGQGGGGITSTITDMGRWGAAELGSALLSDATATQRARASQVQPGLTYGLGLMDYGDGFLGHSGEAIGWQAQVVHNTETGTTIAMATNACNGADLYLFDSIRYTVPITLDPPASASPAASE